MRHTEGEWQADLNSAENSWTISSWNGDKSCGHIAYINKGYKEANVPQIRANAKLIAAAPDLLKALEEVTSSDIIQRARGLGVRSGKTQLHMALVRAHKAIEKAKGL